MIRMIRTKLWSFIASATLATCATNSVAAQQARSPVSGSPTSVVTPELGARRDVVTKHERGSERAITTDKGPRWVRDGVFTRFHPDGSLKAEVVYVNGLEQGVATSYEEGRVTERVTYHQGKRHGESTTYHPNGRVEKTYTYVDGQKHGVAQMFRSDGSLQQQVPYVNDKKHGKYTYYAQFAGQRRVSKEVDYVDGKREGFEIEYRPADGAVTKRSTYVNDVMVHSERLSPSSTGLTPRPRTSATGHTSS